MLYMVIERYLHGPGAVYERFAQRGRMLPDGLEYVSSWVVDDTAMDRCFQLMETSDPELFGTWFERWADLVSFEVFPVLSSAEAAARATAGELPTPPATRWSSPSMWSSASVRGVARRRSPRTGRTAAGLGAIGHAAARGRVRSPRRGRFRAAGTTGMQARTAIDVKNLPFLLLRRGRTGQVIRVGSADGRQRRIVMSQNTARHDAHARSRDEVVDDMGGRQPSHRQGGRPHQPVGQPAGEGGADPGEPDEEEFELIGDNDLGAADLGPLGPNAADPDAGSGRVRKIT